jgi:hypothetical protein
MSNVSANTIGVCCSANIIGAALHPALTGKAWHSHYAYRQKKVYSFLQLGVFGYILYLPGLAY